VATGDEQWATTQGGGGHAIVAPEATFLSEQTGLWSHSLRRDESRTPENRIDLFVLLPHFILSKLYLSDTARVLIPGEKYDVLAYRTIDVSINH
jgi:hypothetical protein